MDVLMDGMRMTLYDPYSNDCYLSVRGNTPGDPEKEEVCKISTRPMFTGPVPFCEVSSDILSDQNPFLHSGITTM